MKSISINLITCALITSMLASMGIQAQTTRDLKRPADVKTVAAAEARTALVIGNAKYATSPLINPSNDASDLAAALKGLDFEVISGIDLDRAALVRKIREFGERLKARGGVGLFFYAGHGVQVAGRNYLIPVDASIRSENEVELEAVDVARVLVEMENAENPLNIVILDACRNNPFSRSWRSTSEGLAQINAPAGTLIAYSTAPGKVAADGAGRNAPYTAALLKMLEVPDLSLGDLFMQVRAEVQQSTGRQQIPWEASSVTGRFFFRKSNGAETSSASVSTSILPPPIPTPSMTMPSLSAEEAYWQEVSRRNTLSGYQLYLAEYPKGRYAAEANSRINAAKAEELRKKKEAEAARWNDAKSADTKDSYNGYLTAFPNGDYVALAKQGIADLDAREERAKWDEAVTLNRKSSIQAYLAAYPNGAYATQAKTKIKEFEKAEDIAKWNEAEGLKTVAAYQGYLKLYPNGAYASLARLRMGDLGVKTAPGGSAPGAVTKNSMGMEFVWIPPGEFMMGSTEEDLNLARQDCIKRFGDENLACSMMPTNEGPRHKVAINSGFWLGRFEVTQGQWQAVMGANPSQFQECGATCPVEKVSWDDAKQFIARLNEVDDGLLYTIPSETEWEYAARAGTDFTFVFGSTVSKNDANLNGANKYGFGRNRLKTVKVGEYKPNAWGLYDMIGNVMEWTEDIYAENYDGLRTDGSANLTVGDPTKRVGRGAAWLYNPWHARPSLRGGILASHSDGTIGLRVAARPRS